MTKAPTVAKLELLPWTDAGVELLKACNTPEQTEYLGGPESEAKLADRQARYLTYHQLGEGEMMMIAHDGEIVGSVGYWETEWKGEAAYETGWAILPAHQGRGLGASGTRAMMERLKPVAKYRYVFAYPTPENPGSNGICHKLGFELIGVEEAEYPKGVWSPHNVWRLDLTAFAPPRT
jgi:RimJ/RimL family protein N-acetyltransferase